MSVWSSPNMDQSQKTKSIASTLEVNHQETSNDLHTQAENFRQPEEMQWLAVPPPFVIALASQKGGVAKTTSAVSLAGALTKFDQQVLVVDLDSQANLTLALGRNPQKIRNAISDVLFNSGSIVSISRETVIPGLDIAPSDTGMELAERFIPVRKNYETILRSAIQEISSIRSTNIPSFIKMDQALSSQQKSINATKRTLENYKSIPRPIYDFIILDCPPSMGAVTLNAMIAADLLIIPSQPEYFSAHALRTMMESIQQIRNNYNANLAYRILITMFDQRNRIHREVKEQIQNTFRDGVFTTTIGVDTKLRESALAGLPISHFRTNSRSSMQYHNLAQEIMDYVKSKSIQ